MTFKEIIKHALKETGTTQQRLAEDMGYSTGQANISKIFTRKDIYMSTLVKMLDKLGYEVIVRKKTQTKDKEDVMVLTEEQASLPPNK